MLAANHRLPALIPPFLIGQLAVVPPFLIGQLAVVSPSIITGI